MNSSKYKNKKSCFISRFACGALASIAECIFLQSALLKHDSTVRTYNSNIWELLTKSESFNEDKRLYYRSDKEGIKCWQFCCFIQVNHLVEFPVSRAVRQDVHFYNLGTFKLVILTKTKDYFVSVVQLQLAQGVLLN